MNKALETLNKNEHCRCVMCNRILRIRGSIKRKMGDVCFKKKNNKQNEFIFLFEKGMELSSLEVAA